MKSILLRLFAALRRSTWFKKYSMGLGCFLLGMQFQQSCWMQIRDTLDVWGISRSDWHTALWIAIGLCLPGLSIWLSAAMTPEDKQVVADKAADKADLASLPGKRE